MQEIKKRRILLASVLKPVDEPRAFEKIGQSLANAGHEVFIAGATSSSKQTIGSITFIQHKVNGRISLSRIAVRLKILRIALKLKPDILIVSTHELLGIALIYRFISRKKIIYDIQENYFKNILYTNAFAKPLRWPVASLVRCKEKITSIFVSGFVLAEKCYENELDFIGKKYCVAENKAKVPNDFQRKPDPDSLKLIFTGTLAESTGIFEAITLAKKLYELDSKVSLEIIGYSPMSSALERIQSEIKDCHFISLIGGDHFITHEKILETIATANFGIISYPMMSHTKDKIPTKLYEYLACGLPFFIQENSSGATAFRNNSTAFSIDFQNLDVNKILKFIQENHSATTIEPNALWINEESALIQFMNRVSFKRDEAAPWP